MSASANEIRANAILLDSDHALRRIGVLRQKPQNGDRVCWHFGGSAVGDEFSSSAIWDSYYSNVSSEFDDSFKSAELEIAALGMFEIWEHATPTKTWIQPRLKNMADFADRVQADLEGWSFEPLAKLPGREIPQAWSDSDNKMDKNAQKN